jgi:protein gp37
MGESSIQWTRYSFNPWLGCHHVHAGCTGCYAEVHQAVAMRKGGRVRWGEVWQGGQRVVVADSTWKQPHTWARRAGLEGVRERVFCASLSDVLEVPRKPETWPGAWSQERINQAIAHFGMTTAAMDTARERLWDTIRVTAEMTGLPNLGPERRAERVEDGRPGLDWLLLTKRPENWRLVPEDVRQLVWLGTSISDQATAEEWVPRLLQAEGFRYRFLSVEPIVGPVDLWPMFSVFDRNGELSGPRVNADGSPAISWVIVGGESGAKARPCEYEWMRDVVLQCREAGVPVFVKQLGSQWAKASCARMPDGEGGTKSDDAGGWINNFPDDLQVRELPGGNL